MAFKAAVNLLIPQKFSTTHQAICVTPTYFEAKSSRVEVQASKATACL